MLLNTMGGYHHEVHSYLQRFHTGYTALRGAGKAQSVIGLEALHGASGRDKLSPPFRIQKRNAVQPLHPLIRQRLAADVNPGQVNVAHAFIRKALGSDVVPIHPQPVIRTLVNLRDWDSPFQHPMQPFALWNGDAQITGQYKGVGYHLVRIQRFPVGPPRARDGRRSGLMRFVHIRSSNEKEQPGFFPHCS